MMGRPSRDRVLSIGSTANRGDRAFDGITTSATIVLVGSLVLLFGTLAWTGAPSLGPLISNVGGSSSGLPSGGLLHATYGMALCTMLMTIAVVPVGVASAIHLSEYATQSSLLVRGVRTAVRTLAAVPSVVLGLFGLGFFVLFVGRGLDAVLAPGAAPVYGRPAVLWASATLAILTLPVVIVTTEEALRGVPRELREASHALGATKLQTIRHVILPAARSGILTGVILATSRGAGEVAAILFTGVASWLPELPTDVRDGFMHLGYHIYVLATQAPDVEGSASALFASAFVFVLVTAGLNALAFVLRDRARQRST